MISPENAGWANLKSKAACCQAATHARHNQGGHLRVMYVIPVNLTNNCTFM